MLNLVGIQYLLGPQHWTSTIFQLGWGPKSPATYICVCVKETEGGSPRSQKGPWRDGPRYLKSRISGTIFEGKTLSEHCVSLEGPRTVALVENVGRG
jgi:hypothetical protein